MRKKLILFYIFWSILGIYGIIFNLSYIDEAKYIIKGKLILDGEISYFKTSGFLYQHMPGSLLWFGIGQKIFGLSLLTARIQAFLTGLLIPIFTFILAYNFKNRAAAFFSIILLLLSPTIIFYYSSATPVSLIALLFLLAFVFLYKERFLFSSLSFTFLFIIRENFLFTLIFYFIFIAWILKKKLKIFVINLLASLTILALFILPGLKKILEIISKMPGGSYILPISSEEKIIFSQNWQQSSHTTMLLLKAIAQFWSIYQIWILISIIIIFFFVTKKRQLRINKLRFFAFMFFISLFNLLAHFFAAFQLSPRSIIGYFSYFAPLFAVIIGFLLAEILDSFGKIKINYHLVFFLGLICFGIPSLREVSIFSFPFKKPDLLRIHESVRLLKNIIPKDERVVWLAEPLPLYLAGGHTYYPLLNHTNFYKESSDTEVVKRLGFWNQQMLADWLKETNFVFIDPDKFISLSQNHSGQELTLFLQQYLDSNYQLIKILNNNFWPNNLVLFKKKNI